MTTGEQFRTLVRNSQHSNGLHAYFDLFSRGADKHHNRKYIRSTRINICCKYYLYIGICNMNLLENQIDLSPPSFANHPHHPGWGDGWTLHVANNIFIFVRCARPISAMCHGLHANKNTHPTRHTRPTNAGKYTFCRNDFYCMQIENRFRFFLSASTKIVLIWGEAIWSAAGECVMLWVMHIAICLEGYWKTAIFFLLLVTNNLHFDARLFYWQWRLWTDKTQCHRTEDKQNQHRIEPHRIRCLPVRNVERRKTHLIQFA